MHVKALSSVTAGEGDHQTDGRPESVVVVGKVTYYELVANSSYIIS
jgi:hypothetical protein